MSIQWGSWVGSGHQRMRLGVEFTSVPTPTSSQTTVNVKSRILVQADYSFHDTSNTFAYNGSVGSHSGAKSINVGSNSTQVLATFSTNFTVSGSAVALTIYTSLTGINYVGAGLKANAKGTATIPAPSGGGGGGGGSTATTIPKPPPTATLGTVTDTSQVLNWGNPGGPDWPDSYKVERADGNYGGNSTVGSNLKTRSLTAHGTEANNRYAYRVAAVNEFGQSAWKYFPNVYTTPSKPDLVYAKRIGNTIKITWTNHAPWATHVRIVESRDGGAWVYKVTVPVAEASSYTDTSPNLSQTHRYAVQNLVGSVAISSGFSYTSTVTLASKPNPPTLLEPAQGAIFEKTGTSSTSVDFKWNHNSTDSSEQTTAQFEYRRRPTSTSWTTTTISDDSEFLNNKALSHYSDTTIEWRVRTKGVHDDWSDWSGIRTLYVYAKPTFTLTGPSTASGNQVEVTWNYSDPQGLPAGDTYLSLGEDGEAPIWSGLAGSTSPFTIPVAVPESTAYVITGWAKNDKGIQSDEDTLNLSVRYQKPAQPALEAEWMPDTLSTKLVIRSAEDLKIARTSYNPSHQFGSWVYASGSSGTYYQPITFTPPGEDEIVEALETNWTHLQTDGRFSYISGSAFRFKITVDIDVEESFPSVMVEPGTIIEPIKAGQTVIIEGRNIGSGEIDIQVTDLDSSQKLIFWDFDVFEIPDDSKASSIFDSFDENTFRDEFYYGLDDNSRPYEAYAVDAGQGDGLVEPTTSSRIFRSDDFGGSWQLYPWLDNLPPTTDVVDPLPPLAQVVEYLPEAVSDLPSTEDGDIRSVITTSQEAAFNLSSDLSDSLIVACDMTMPSGLAGDYTTSHVFSKRPLPVNVYDLDHEPVEVVSFSATIGNTRASEVAEFIKLMEKQNIFYRDFRGRNFWAKVTGAGVDPNHGHPIFTATVTESDHIG